MASWPFFLRRGGSLRIHSDMLVVRALKNSQLIRQLPDETHVSYGTGHLNQSLRGRAARDAIGLHLLPQLAGESVTRLRRLRRIAEPFSGSYDPSRFTGTPGVGGRSGPYVPGRRYPEVNCRSNRIHRRTL